MSNPKTKTDEAWEELCAASDAPAPTGASLTREHPFAKLGPKPYCYAGQQRAQGSCALCGRRIATLYYIESGDHVKHAVGSECVLKMNGFEAHIVAHVRTAKRRFDREARAAAKVRKAARESEEFAKNFPREVEWLRAYRGNFDFYLSLRAQFEQKGYLSDNQVAALTRAVERDATRAAAPKPAPREFSLKAGSTLIVSRFIARKIGEEFRLGRAHFALEVIEVQAESMKAWKVRAKLAAKRTIRCCVCGAELDNAESRARGIGPICAEKYGVDSVEALALKFEQDFSTHVIETWIPKSQVKEIQQ